VREARGKYRGRKKKGETIRKGRRGRSHNINQELFGLERKETAKAVSTEGSEEAKRQKRD